MPSSHYGLQKLSQSESLPTNDYSFGNFNIDVIDRFLYKINLALFDQTHPIDTPTTAPNLVLSDDEAGGIPAGRTVYYRYSYVDSYGNETGGSPEASFTTPSPVATPSSASAFSTSTGGSITYGTYFYVLSAYVGTTGNETLPGAATYSSIRSGTANIITLILPSLPAGATGFNIYKKGPGQSIYYYLDSVAGSVSGDQFVDDGVTAINPTRTTTNTNTTNATNTITVELPDAVPDGYTWKLYRSYQSSAFDSSLLAWIVDGSDTYEDVGLSPTLGHPQDQNLIFGDVFDYLTENETGGATPLLWDDFATPTYWDTEVSGAGTAVHDLDSGILLNVDPGTGTGEQAYVTTNPNFQWDRSYGFGFRFTFSGGTPLRDADGNTSLRIAEVSSTNWRFCLHLVNDGGLNKDVVKLAAFVDNGTSCNMLRIADEFSLKFQNELINRGSHHLSNLTSIGDGSPHDIYVIFDFDSQSDATDERWKQKAQVLVYIDGVLLGYVHDQLDLIPATTPTVIVAKAGFLGYVDTSDVSTTSDYGLEMTIDYAYTEELPRTRRTFDPVLHASRWHAVAPNAHPQYQVTQLGKMNFNSESVLSNTTMINPGEFGVLYVHDIDSDHYEFQALLKYAAKTAEDLKIQFQLYYDNGATPYTGTDVIINYHVLPYEMATAGTAGQIYTDSDVVVLEGVGETTFRMVEIRGFVLHDGATPFPAAGGDYGSMRLELYMAKNADDATPGVATVAGGSFLKLIHSYTDAPVIYD